MAFQEKNAAGLLGHYTPEYFKEGEHKWRQMWVDLFEWMDDTSCNSTIVEFEWIDNEAIIISDQKSSISFARPPATVNWFGRLAFGFLAKFVIVQKQRSESSWVKTREGWLCRSEKSLSNKIRLRRRR